MNGHGYTVWIKNGGIFMKLDSVTLMKRLLLLSSLFLSTLSSPLTWDTPENKVLAAQLVKTQGETVSIPFFQKGREVHATIATLTGAVLTVVATTMAQAGVNAFVGSDATNIVPRSLGTKLKHALSAAFTPAQLKTVGLWTLMQTLSDNPTDENLNTFSKRFNQWVNFNKTFVTLTALEAVVGIFLGIRELNRQAEWESRKAQLQKLLDLTDLELDKKMATLAQALEAETEFNALNTETLVKRGLKGALKARRELKKKLDALSKKTKEFGETATTATLEQLEKMEARFNALVEHASILLEAAENVTLAALEKAFAAFPAKLQATHRGGLKAKIEGLEPGSNAEKLEKHKKFLKLLQSIPEKDRPDNYDVHVDAEETEIRNLTHAGK